MKIKPYHFITITGVLMGIVIYGRIPYRKLDLSDINLWLLSGFVSLIGALLSNLRFNQKSTKVGLLITLGVVISAIVRIVYDMVFWDKSSHNLAPFEVVIIVLQILPAAILGAHLSKQLRRFNKSN